MVDEVFEQNRKRLAEYANKKTCTISENTL